MWWSRDDEVSVRLVNDECDVISLGEVCKGGDQIRGVYGTCLGNK